VRFWLHGEFLVMNKAKIAKSSGPVPRLADLVEAGYHPMAYRLFALGGHYRSQLDFTTNAVDAAQATLRRLAGRVDALRPLPAAETYEVARALLPPDDKVAAGYLEQIDAAVAADMATPKILAALQESLRDTDISTEGLRVVVAAADALLGLGLAALEVREVDRRRSAADLDPAEVELIERKIAERTQARMDRNWVRADEIRAELEALGVQVTDTPAGPTWELT
jgi:cysteinyl-tRNA synthetase